MSNVLAIATVSAALRQRILAAVGTAVTGSVDIGFGRPPTTPPQNRLVNIYLYRVTPNAALRNRDMPTRDGAGRLGQRPRAAIELHYLLSFYGDSSDLEPERLLAAVLRDMHAQPVLDSQTIGDAVSGDPVLAGSDLDDAEERVRFTLEMLTLDELSRLWSLMVQSPYAVSVAFAAMPVLLDALETGPAALPVLKRGEQDRGVETRLGSRPQLDRAWIGFPASRERVPQLPSLRAAQPGALLLIDGSNLAGDTVTLGFEHRLPPVVDLVVPLAARTAGRLEVTLPDPPAADWAAGLYSVVATITRGAETLRTTVWPMPLAPRVASIVSNPGPGQGVTLTVTCSPPVRDKQLAILRVGGVDIPAAAHPATTDTLDFVLDPVPTLADELVWLRIDDVESMPFVFDAASNGFAYDAAQRVTLP